MAKFQDVIDKLNEVNDTLALVGAEAEWLSTFGGLLSNLNSALEQEFGAPIRQLHESLTRTTELGESSSQAYQAILDFLQLEEVK